VGFRITFGRSRPMEREADRSTGSPAAPEHLPLMPNRVHRKGERQLYLQVGKEAKTRRRDEKKRTTGKSAEPEYELYVRAPWQPK
jgi:hypothetical protein